MRISLSPMRRDGALSVSKSGDILTINGEAFNFASLPDGATIPAGVVPCEWITGPVSRIDGDLHLTLILPHGPHPTQEQAFPEPIINPADGVIALSQNVEEETADVDA
jgi:hypothetical protein